MNKDIRKVVGRSLALTILAVLAWIIVLILVEPIIGSILTERSWRSHTIEQASHLATLIARRGAIVAEVDRIAISRKGELPLWKGTSDVSLAAKVEGLVRSFIPADGQALSVSSDAPFSENGLRHIGIHMDLVMSIPGMTSFLERVEAAKPRLFIDRLSVTAPPASDLNQPPRVSLYCDISAFAEARATR